jgi:hypothetical protein
MHMGRVIRILDVQLSSKDAIGIKKTPEAAHMHAIAQDYLRLMGTLPYGRRLAAPHQVHMFSTVTGP